MTILGAFYSCCDWLAKLASHPQKFFIIGKDPISLHTALSELHTGNHSVVFNSTMGRKSTLTSEERRAQKQERDRKRRLDPVILAKRREQGRVRQRERYRQASSTSHNPLALLADTATQAQMLEEVGENDNDDGEMLGEIRSAAECTEVGTGSFEDEGTFIQLHGDGEGFNLVGIYVNFRNSC